MDRRTDQLSFFLSFFLLCFLAHFFLFPFFLVCRSVGPSVIFLNREHYFALLPLPNRPRLWFRVSGFFCKRSGPSVCLLVSQSINQLCFNKKCFCKTAIHHAFIPLIKHLVVHSFIQSFIHSIDDLFIHLFICS